MRRLTFVAAVSLLVTSLYAGVVVPTPTAPTKDYKGVVVPEKFLTLKYDTSVKNQVTVTWTCADDLVLYPLVWVDYGPTVSYGRQAGAPYDKVFRTASVVIPLTGGFHFRCRVSSIPQGDFFTGDIYVP